MGHKSDDGMDPDRNDALASAVTAAGSIAPGAGPLIAQAITHLIPRQRVDRIVRFVRALELRLSAESAARLQDRQELAEQLDIIEEALLQATRATSEDRIAYLATLVGVALGDEKISHEKSRIVLRLLSQLSDAEIVVLASETRERSWQRDPKFHDTHKHILEVNRENYETDSDELDASALYAARKDWLESLGLYASLHDVGGTKSEVTRVGRMLLHHVGLLDGV